MNINEAIEILTKWRNEESIDDEEKLHQAEALSIEALKRILEYRETITPKGIWLLLGETDE